MVEYTHKMLLWKVVGLGLLALLLWPIERAESKNEKVMMKVSKDYKIDGHEYVLLTPVFTPSVGAWRIPDKHAHTLNMTSSHIEPCHADEEIAGLAKDSEGKEHPVLQMYLECESGRYKIDTIYFTPPVEEQK